jgi:hypothetical protein
VSSEGSATGSWWRLLSASALPWWTLDDAGVVTARGSAHGAVDVDVGVRFVEALPPAWRADVRATLAAPTETACSLGADGLGPHVLSARREPGGTRVVIVEREQLDARLTQLRTAHRHALVTALVRVLAHDAGNELMGTVTHAELARTLVFEGEAEERDRVLELAIAGALRVGDLVRVLGAASSRRSAERRAIDLHALLTSFAPTARLLVGRRVVLHVDAGHAACAAANDDALIATLSEVLLGVRVARCTEAWLVLEPGPAVHRLRIDDRSPREPTRAAIELPAFVREDQSITLALAADRLGEAGGVLDVELRPDGSRCVELSFPATTPA